MTKEIAFDSARYESTIVYVHVLGRVGDIGSHYLFG